MAVNPFDAVIAILFFSPIGVVVAFGIFLVIFWLFIKPLIPGVLKWLAEIRVSDEKHERADVSILEVPNSFKNKILEVEYDSSFTRAKLGKIIGWSKWKPNYIVFSESKDPMEIENNIKKAEKEYTPRYEVFIIEPANRTFLDSLLGRSKGLLFEKKQIKYIDDTRVILRGSSIEPNIVGYMILTLPNTPIKELASAMSFEKTTAMLDQKILNLKKLVELALRINPNQMSELQLTSPRLDVPVPSKKVEPTVAQVR